MLIPGCTSSVVGFALSMAASSAWGMVAFDLAEAGSVSRGARLVANDARLMQEVGGVREKRM